MDATDQLWLDSYGFVYSADGKRMLKGANEQHLARLFLAEPVFRQAVHQTVLEAETEVIHRLTQHGWCGPLGIEIGITAGECGENLCGSPPSALAVFRLAECLVYHLHQVDGTLIGHILLNQHLNLVVLQPEPLTFIK